MSSSAGLMPPKTDTILRADNINIYYGDFLAVRDVTRLSDRQAVEKVRFYAALIVSMT